VCSSLVFRSIGSRHTRCQICPPLTRQFDAILASACARSVIGAAPCPTSSATCPSGRRAAGPSSSAIGTRRHRRPEGRCVRCSPCGNRRSCFGEASSRASGRAGRGTRPPRHVDTGGSKVARPADHRAALRRRARADAQTEQRTGFVRRRRESSTGKRSGAQRTPS